MLLNQFADIRRLVKTLIFLSNSNQITSSEREDILVLINQLIDKIE